MIAHGWAAVVVAFAGGSGVYLLGVYTGRAWQRATEHIEWDARQRPQIDGEGARPDALTEVSPGVRLVGPGADEGRAGSPLPGPPREGTAEYPTRALGKLEGERGPITDPDDPRYYYPPNRAALRELYAQHERDGQDQAAEHAEPGPEPEAEPESAWLAELAARDTGQWLAINAAEIAEAEQELKNDRAGL